MQSIANPLQMRGELISTNEEQKKSIFIIRQQVKLRTKSTLCRRLIKLITSDEDINFSESFNSAANKKHERCPKNQNQKRKMTKTGYFRDIAMLNYGLPERYRGIFSMVPLVHYLDTLPFTDAIVVLHRKAKILFKPMSKINALNSHCNRKISTFALVTIQ